MIARPTRGVEPMRLPAAITFVVNLHADRVRE